MPGALGSTPHADHVQEDQAVLDEDELQQVELPLAKLAEDLFLRIVNLRMVAISTILIFA